MYEGKNREDDFREEKWSGRWKGDNNIGSLGLQRWLINQERCWENSLTCNLWTMHRPPFSFLPLSLSFRSFLLAPTSAMRTHAAVHMHLFHGAATRRGWLCATKAARLCLSSIATLTAIQIRIEVCGNRPTLNVNCCLNLWQSALHLSARVLPHRPGPRSTLSSQITMAIHFAVSPAIPSNELDD